MRKFFQTLRIAATLVMARTFGRYVHSGWDGYHDFSKYEWRGRVWHVPLGPDDRGEWINE